jgi:hypothetical protein
MTEPNTSRSVPAVSAGPTPSAFFSEAEAGDYQERAAIREFDGGLSRAAAERLAWLDTLTARAALRHHYAHAREAEPMRRAG